MTKRTYEITPTTDRAVRRFARKPDATAEIEFQIDKMAPGHYVCEYVALTDGEATNPFMLRRG